MGSSYSRGSAVAAAVSLSTSSERDRATAKLVLPDGDLQEFSWPVTASHVLRKDPTCFICHSDAMDFDGSVSAIGADEELRPGNLYFVLPVSSLRRPLAPVEMAALAAKASCALSRNGYAVFADDDDHDKESERKRPGGGCGRRRGSRLDTIQEGSD